MCVLNDHLNDKKNVKFIHYNLRKKYVLKNREKEKKINEES